MRTELVTPPDAAVVSLAEAKLAARIDADLTEDDDFVASLVTAATRLCERLLGQQCVTATRRLWLDRFPCSHGGLIELPRGPLQSVASVKYLDAADELQTLDAEAYDVDAISLPPRLRPAPGYSWPSTRARLNAVQIEYDCGHGDPADVPETIKAAVKLLVAHWYKNREAVITGTISGPIAFAVQSLLDVEWDGSYTYVGDEA